MKATIKIEMDNAAFDETPATEVARILRSLASDIERNPPHERGNVVNTVLRDINGNAVGNFEIKPKRDFFGRLRY